MTQGKSTKEETRAHTQPRGAEQQQETQDPFLRAHQSYAKVLQELWDAWLGASKEAYQSYVCKLFDVWMQTGGAAEQYKQAYEGYRHSLEESWEKLNVSHKLDDAYRSYLRELKAAWGGVDVDKLAPQSLVALTWGMVAASQYAWETVPPRS